MAIIKQDPHELFKDINELVKWEKWGDYNGGEYDFWHDGVIHIFKEYKTYKSYQKTEPTLPLELVECLNKIKELLWSNFASFKPTCPIKHAAVGFVYKDEAYEITPASFGLTYEVKELNGWEDCYFEQFHRKIEEILKTELGIIYTRYNGFVD